MTYEGWRVMAINNIDLKFKIHGNLMGKNCGIIYKITNISNGKIYIGKTKKYYGKNETKLRGIKGRLNRHINDAINKRDYCPLLCKAIRKYGKNNFIIEQLTQCKLELTSDLEIAFINYYNSTNFKKGYNISKGGGALGCRVDETTREKISKKLNGDLNIHKIYRKGIHVGYRSQRKEKGFHFYKTFANTNFSLDENYNKAKDWIEEIKEGKLEDKKYKKENKLPTNITYKRKKGIIKGYRVNIRIIGKLYSQDFTADKYNMNEKLQQAINYKKSILPE